MGIKKASDEQQLNQSLKENPENLKVIIFLIEKSDECSQVSDVIRELDKIEDNKEISFVEVDASKNESACNKYEVESVPTVLFYMNGEVTDKVVGANIPLLSKKLAEQKEKLSSGDLNARIEKLIRKAPVMLFMKGNPSVPRCGFSKQVIALLDSHKAKYETFDILEDWDVREGLKKFSNWPTYPQLYISGELVGGLDILKELSENGELDDLLKSAGQ